MRLIIVMAVLVAACGGDDGSPGVDAPSTTGCGTGPPCDFATEICVVSTPVGPGEAYDCVAVPAGCTGDRTCDCVGDTLCTGTFDTCTDRPATANTVACECPQCQ
jgi:hypothetical protein